MKDFIEWAKEKGLYDEIAWTEKGKKDFELSQVAKNREKKGAGKGQCPICHEEPCCCGTAKIKNRLKKYQQMKKG